MVDHPHPRRVARPAPDPQRPPLPARRARPAAGRRRRRHRRAGGSLTLRYETICWTAERREDRRLHDLPGAGRRVRRRGPARQGQGEGLLDLRVHDLREHTTDVHRTVDDTPFGGGAGMVLRPEPGLRRGRGGRPAPARCCSCRPRRPPARPGRRPPSWPAAAGFSLLCGRYEGVDERVAEHLCDGELSIGDYVLAGGEVAALVVLEAVGRLVPGVMGNEASGARGVVRRRAARAPAVHPAGRVPGLGGARGAALRRPRPHRPLAPGRWPWPAPLERRPDLVAARGGLTAEERGWRSWPPSWGRPILRRPPRAPDRETLRHEPHRPRRPRLAARRHPRVRRPATP